MTSPVQVLYIEDNLDDIAQITSYLEQRASHIGLKVATSLTEAKTVLASNPFDSIVLDYKLPDGNSLDFLLHLKAVANAAVPIFLMEPGDCARLTRILDEGACFHISKGPQYWECLPSMIAQAIENSRVLEKEKSKRIALEKTVAELTARLESSEVAPDTHHSEYHELPETLARERDELMSRISHEIKTPLTAVLGFAHMMVARPDAALEKRQKWSFFIESKSEQLNRLVDNMLDLSDLQAGYLVLNKHEANLGALIRDAVEAMEGTAPERHFQLDIPEGLPEIKMDVDRIAQVILNLLTNADHLSPDGQPVEVVLRNTGDQVELRVIDHGTGIPPEDRQRAFEPFSAEPGAGYQPSKGLWLPLAHALIEAHGGRLWIEPTPDHGSTFILSLPIA